MESTGKVTDSQRVRKPEPVRIQSPELEQEPQNGAQYALGGHSLENLPAGPGTRALRQEAVLQMQRTHGNAHVMRQIDPAIRRQEEDGAAASPAGPSSISGSGGSVDTGGGGVEISGGVVKVHSGMVEVDGVLKTDTIIANSVVGSSYTPGAGNVW